MSCGQRPGINLACCIVAADTRTLCLGPELVYLCFSFCLSLLDSAF